MAEQTELVTVYRSADESAQDDALGLNEALNAQGVKAMVFDDEVPGVPAGAWEIRVPPDQTSLAEEIIRNFEIHEMEEPDESHELDLETVFSASGGTTQEMESTAVKSLLEDAGIATITVGDPVLPNLAFEIRVAKEHAERARQIIAEAQAAGPAAAEEAERAGEAQ